MYLAGGAVPSGSWLLPVYRLSSPKTHRHYYTIHRQHRDALLSDKEEWISEGTAFYAFAKEQPGTRPVYHLYEEIRGIHFFTMDEAEKDTLLRTKSPIWVLRGIAFYVYRETSGTDLAPVYRLRSRKFADHLLTASVRERTKLMKDSSSEWADEGIAWYVRKP